MFISFGPQSLEDISAAQRTWQILSPNVLSLKQGKPNCELNDL